MCHRDEGDNVTRLIGLTASLERDPRVGIDGRRPIGLDGCQGIAADGFGHLYLASERQADDALDSRLVVELLRTDSSGNPDIAWGDAGHVVVERGGLDIELASPDNVFWAAGFGFAASPMVAQADGSVLVAARVARIDPAGQWTAAVLRLTADGALDPSFGSGGIKAFGPSGGESQIMAMAVDAVGRPVISVAYRHTDGRTRHWLARLTATGGFDQTFGQGGLIGQTYPAMSIAIDADGRILTYARTSSGTTVAARRNG